MTPGTDYAVARVITWVFPIGPAKGFALVTRSRLLMFPYRLIVGRSTIAIGGRDALTVLDESIARGADLESAIDDWTMHLQGPLVKPLAVFRRIRIFSGFFRRSVVFSEKAEGFDRGGPGGTALGFRPTKPELAVFSQFFAGDPRLDAR
jgi:hypothetical protein